MEEMLEYLQELENEEGTELQICSLADSQYVKIVRGGTNPGTWMMCGRLFIPRRVGQ